MFWVVPCRPQNLCLTSNSRLALKTVFLGGVRFQVCAHTNFEAKFSLLILFPFPFLNGKECLVRLLDRLLSYKVFMIPSTVNLQRCRYILLTVPFLVY